MKYNVSYLDKDLQEVLKEFSLFELDNQGLLLQAMQGDENYTKLEVERLTICYTNKARFVYSLFLFNSVGYTGDTNCKFDAVTAMVDMSRNAVGKVSSVKKLMRQLSRLRSKKF